MLFVLDVKTLVSFLFPVLLMLTFLYIRHVKAILLIVNPRMLEILKFFVNEILGM